MFDEDTNNEDTRQKRSQLEMLGLIRRISEKLEKFFNTCVPLVRNNPPLYNSIEWCLVNTAITDDNEGRGFSLTDLELWVTATEMVIDTCAKEYMHRAERASRFYQMSSIPHSWISGNLKSQFDRCPLSKQSKMFLNITLGSWL
jgi:hypothetical protein